MTRFNIVSQRSELSAEAKSSVHPIHGDASGISGWIDAMVSDGQIDSSQPAKAHLEFPTDSLQADNKLINREVQRRLNSRRFPTVKAEIDEVRELAAGRFAVQGELNLHGVTRAVSGEASVTVASDGSLQVEGELTLDIRQFDLDPPKLLGMRVYPDVDVRLRVSATPDE